MQPVRLAGAVKALDRPQPYPHGCGLEGHPALRLPLSGATGVAADEAPWAGRPLDLGGLVDRLQAVL